MKKWALIPVIGLLLTACASTHPGKIAQQTAGDKIDGLVISAEQLSNNEDGFAMVAITFENQSPEWLRVDKTEVLIDEESAKKVSVVVGKDLVDWASAMEARAKKEKHNREMVQLGVAAVGAVATVAGAANNDRNTTYAGLAVLGASQAWVVTDAITTRLDTAKNPRAVPQDHIYQPFAVPGKMFLRRWVLLNKPASSKISILPLAITTVDGKRTVVNVTL